MSVTSLFGHDLAIDLGTANTLVYERGQGIVVDEPSVVASNGRSHAVLAVGSEAKEMIGRTPGNIRATRPLRDGVIANFDVTEKMLRYFIQRVHRRRLGRGPRVVVCVPSGITGVEQRAVVEATVQAGARAAYVVEEPVAAAIGAGLSVHEPAGNLIVDIGGGTTEVALLSLGGIVASRSIRVGGDEIDAAIASSIKRAHSLLLGERSAEELKITLGNALPTAEVCDGQVRGRDLVAGLPRTVTITSEELRQAIEEPVSKMLTAVKDTLDKAPPELAADTMDRGIVVTGGGALLRGLDERLRVETGMPIHVPEDPQTSVARGSGACLEEFEALQRVLVASS